MVKIHDYWHKEPRREFYLAKDRIANLIDDVVLFHGEWAWNNMPLKERYQIIEDTIRDNCTSLTEEEIKLLIRIEQAKEG